MKDEIVLLLTLVIIVLMFYIRAVEDYNYFISKNDWSCVQSRTIDPKNVDKQECVNYQKTEK